MFSIVVYFSEWLGFYSVHIKCSIFVKQGMQMVTLGATQTKIINLISASNPSHAACCFFNLYFKLLRKRKRPLQIIYKKL